MILDAKTIFVNPLSIDRIINNKGQLNLFYHPIQPVFEPSKKIVSELFNIDLDVVAEPLGVPFFFNNCIVRAMIAKINDLNGEEFPTWFQNKGMVTEFILYSGYVLYKDQTMDLMYAGGRYSIGLCSNLCHTQVAQFDDKFQDMLNSITVSIHRNAWKQLTNEQKTNYINLLYDRGITVAKTLK
jgi:hypothetical protein